MNEKIYSGEIVIKVKGLRMCGDRIDCDTWQDGSKTYWLWCNDEIVAYFPDDEFKLIDDDSYNGLKYYKMEVIKK